MNQGWISLHRKILDNPIVCKDSDYFSVWCYLLLNATHDNYDAVFKGNRITLKPGQLITGRKSIANQFGINESKVKRILLSLENDQQIDRERSNKNSLITVLNWDNYQNIGQQSDQQVTSKRPASDQQVTTNNNVNNENNKKIDDFFEKCWKLYPRKEGKGSVSKTQKKKLFALGDEFVHCIERYVVDKKGTEKKYLKQGSTFFNSGYIDYLDENYRQEQKPTIQKIDRTNRVKQRL